MTVAAATERPFAIYQFLGWHHRNPAKWVVVVPDAHVAFQAMVGALPAPRRQVGRPRGDQKPVTDSGRLRQALEAPEPEFLAATRLALCLPVRDEDHRLGPTDEWVVAEAKKFVDWYATTQLTGG
jgi:hypothetical protein